MNTLKITDRKTEKEEEKMLLKNGKCRKNITSNSIHTSSSVFIAKRKRETVVHHDYTDVLANG